MSLGKNWWMILLVGVGLGLGIVYFKNFNLVKDKETGVKNIIKSDQKTEVVVDKKLTVVEKQVAAEVVSWNGGQNELIFKITESQEVLKTKVDPTKMSIFIPESQHKTNAVLPLIKGDKNWETAFCPQDGLTVGYGTEGEVKMLFNIGYRMCGFKGE